MKTAIKLSVVAAAFALAACAPADPKLKEVEVAQPKAVDKPKPTPTPAIKETDRAKVSNQYESPKVDVLFVIDHSVSMDKHQKNLVANIGQFARAFVENEDVDFHVGVVKVFDSITYGNSVPNGQLVNGFVSRSADTVNDLKKLLNVGVLPLDKGGPQFEEIFSPIIAAFSEENLKTVNKDFYRPDAHLAIILVTDANDASPNIDETNVEGFLFRLKNKRPEKYSIYGVISQDTDGRTCAADPSGTSARIENLIKMTKGHKFSLCDRKFGEKLGKVGSDIAAKAVFKRVVELSRVPNKRYPIVVKCQGEEVPEKHLKYDERALTVSIESTYQKCREDSDEIEVTYVILDSKNLQTDRK